jgi:GxxExxY protein
MRTGGQEERLVALGEAIIGAALKVHTALGPGMLESVYEACLAHELVQSGLSVKTQVPVPVVYGGAQMDTAFRLDILVENLVALVLKAVERLLPIHKAQLISYLRLGDYPLGYLLNFNVIHMREGIKRVVGKL